MKDRPRIIVVDDDLSLLASVSRRLAQHGYQVFGFSETDRAFQEIMQGDLTFALLLTDLELGSDQMTGEELIFNLRLENRTEPMILWTGRSEPPEPMMHGLGANLVMRKSDAGRLIENIEQLLCIHG